jgi:hypothetical protein
VAATCPGGFTLIDLWMINGVRRDHAAALDYVDWALRQLGDDPGRADLRLYALEVRIFTLQNLARWADAEQALQQAREFAHRSGHPERATSVTTAVLRYWFGQWVDALAELGSDPDPLQDAVAHYRAAGPALELPAALEDLAVVLAECGHEADARAALNEAVSLYDGLQARWDIRRAGRCRCGTAERSVVTSPREEVSSSDD